MARRFPIGLLLPLLALVAGVFPGCERNWAGPDTTPPTVVYARWVNDTQVDVGFDEEVERTSAEDVANYSIVEAGNPDEVLSVVGASLQADQKVVQLTTSAQKLGTTYTVSVANVQDLEGNPLSGDNTADFTNGTVLTYERDIQTILDSKCIVCHGSGGVMASKPLTTYDEVMAFVDNGTLKEKAEGGHQTFDEESSQMVIDWIDAGAPEN